jgi:hypothetical protein
MEDDVSYPDDSRYTLQWIVAPNERSTLFRIPNNNDATFKDQSLPKPAEILLHYNYGAAAVKHWGKNNAALTERLNLPRLPVPAPAPMGPARGIHNRNITIEKRRMNEKRKRDGTQDDEKWSRPSGSPENKTREPEAKRQRGGDDPESHGCETWDEDDIMLFFWGNSRAARERRALEEEERDQNMEKWRSAVFAEGLRVNDHA